MDRTFWPTLLLLAAVFALFEATGLDLQVQDRFYDFNTQTWMVGKDAPLPRLFFYTGPKVLIAGLAVVMLTLALFRRRFNNVALPTRRDLIIAVLTLALAPSLVSLSKATTDVYCPYQITRYGGKMPYLKVIEPFPEEEPRRGRGRGFPAGHASGGFALVALAGLSRSRRGKLTGFLIGQTAGWAMGIYQMLKGAHYLSHTIITCLFCWIVFLALRRMIPSTGWWAANDSPS